MEDLTKADFKDFLPKIESIHFVNTLQQNSECMSKLRLKIMNVAERAEATPAGLIICSFRFFPGISILVECIQRHLSSQPVLHGDDEEREIEVL